ncbi:MAG: colicin uptake protein TolR [Arsenophonus sp.]
MKMDRVRYRRELKYEINIVPLLDILLVLLLIFMSTAPIILQNLKVELPNAPKSKFMSDTNKSLIIFEISGVGQYSIIIGNHRKNILQTEKIQIIIKNILAKNSNSIFLIGSSKNIPYEEIIKILSILHQTGIRTVGFMTQPI